MAKKKNKISTAKPRKYKKSGGGVSAAASTRDYVLRHFDSPDPRESALGTLLRSGYTPTAPETSVDDFDFESFDGSKAVSDQYRNVSDEIKQNGINMNRTVYGNIDTDNRKVLKWDSEKLKKYKNEINDWMDEAPIIGQKSTVLGAWDEYGGVKVAYSPMLQTQKGAVLMSRAAVNNYIQSLVEKVKKEHPSGWTTEDLLKLDKEGNGQTYNGEPIKGLIAGVGDEAENISLAMHYTGKDGAGADAIQTEMRTRLKKNPNTVFKPRTGLNSDEKAELDTLRKKRNRSSTQAEAIASEINRYDDDDDLGNMVYLEWARTYDEAPEKLTGRPLEIGRRVSEKIKEKNRLIGLYNRYTDETSGYDGRISKLERKTGERDANGVRLANGEVDYTQGAADARKNADRITSGMAVPAGYTDAEVYAATHGDLYSPRIKELADMLKRGNATKNKAAVEKSKERAYDYYGRNKDNTYGNNIIGRAFGNMMVGDIGIKTNEAGKTLYDANSDDLEAVGVYQTLSNRITQRNKATFTNNNDFDRNWATFFNYVPQFVEQSKHRLAGMAVGATLGAMSAGAVGASEGARLGGSAAVAKFMFDQTAGAAYVRHLQNSGLSVEDAKKLASSEAIPSSLIEFGLDFAISGLFKGVGGTAGKIMQRFGTNAGKIEGGLVKGLMRTGLKQRAAETAISAVKSAGKTALSGLGEGAEEWLQSALEKTADRAAQRGQALNPLELVGESLDFTQYTAQDLAEMNQEFLGGALIGLVGAPLRAGSFGTVNKMIDVVSEPSLGKQVREANQANSTIEAGLQSANRRTVALANKVKNGGSGILGNWDLGRLYKAVTKEKYRAAGDVIGNEGENLTALVKKGLSRAKGSDAHKIAKDISERQKKGQYVAQTEVDALVEANDKAEQEAARQQASAAPAPVAEPVSEVPEDVLAERERVPQTQVTPELGRINNRLILSGMGDDIRNDIMVAAESLNAAGRNVVDIFNTVDKNVRNGLSAIGGQPNGSQYGRLFRSGVRFAADANASITPEYIADTVESFLDIAGQSNETYRSVRTEPVVEAILSGASDGIIEPIRNYISDAVASDVRVHNGIYGVSPELNEQAAAVARGDYSFLRSATAETSAQPETTEQPAASAQPEKTVTLYPVGDFYEVYGDDARAVAQAAGLHLSSKVIRGKRTPMTGFPKTALSSYAPQIGSYAIADADTIADEIVRSGFNDDRLINTDAVRNMSDDDLKVINDIIGGRNVDITPNSEATENSTGEGTTTSDNIIRTLKKSSISTVFKGENKVVFYDSFILSPYFAVPRSSANEAAVRKAVKGEIKTSSANIGADALIPKNYTEVNSEARVMTGAPIDGKKIDLYVYNIDGKLWGVQQKYLNAVSGYILRAGELRGRFMFNAVDENGDLIAVLPPVKMNNLTETEFDKLPTVTEVLSQNVAKPKAMFTPSELKTLNSPSRHMGKFKTDRGTVLSSGGYFELLCADDEIASLEQDYTHRHKNTSWGSDEEKDGFPEETGAPKRAWELVSNAENINTEMRGASKNFNAAIIDGKYAVAFDKKYTNILKKRSTKLVLRDTDNHTVLAGVDENGDLTGFFPPIRSSVANKESSDGLEFVDKISDATSNKGSSETAAAENQTDLTDKCELIETTHTKTGEALWVIRVKDKLSKDEYAELQAKVKEVGGYYSRFAKTPDGKSAPGFVFKTEPDNAVIKVFNSFFGATSEKKPAETSNTGLNIETKDDTIEENTAKTPTQKVADFIYKRLAAGEKTTGEELFRAAKEAYQGGMADGTFTPKDAYDAMELGVNQYILSLDEVSSEKMLDILDKLPTQTKRTEAMEKYQQFSTPPSIAYLASYAANINSNDIMLEPSAGIGGIAVFAKREGATVYVNELDKRRLGVIKNLPFDGFYNENAEQIHNILGRKIKPTVVVMNPPFSSSSERNVHNTKIGAKHLEQALKMLVPGGRLVAITGKGMANNAPAFKAWWKDIKTKYNVVANIGVDGKNYNKYGTSFDIQMIVIDNNGPTKNTITGNVSTLKELQDYLRRVRNGRTEIDYDGLSRTTETADTARERNTGTEARERSTDESGEESSRSQAVSDTSRGDDADRRGSDESVDDGNRLSGTSGRAESDVSGRAADVDNGRTDADGRRDRGADDGREVSGQQRSEADRGLRREGSEEQGRDVEEDARSIDAERAAEYNNRESDRSGTEAGDDGDGGRGLSEQSDDLRVKPKKTKKKKFLTDSIYDDYVVQPLKVKNARPHPTKVSESSAMASVSKPAITYKPHIQQELIDNGVLSDVQLEPISYAGQNHQHFLENGKRKGFFIGDGTGLGKGRIVAGIILDNRNQGRNKAVWISERPNLFSDAQRDIKAVVGDENLVHQFEGGKKADKSLSFDDGVLFAAYSTISRGWDKPGSNFEKIASWLGKDYDGVIAFDESHNMANSGGGKKGWGKSSKGGSDAYKMGRALSEQFPKARIVYLSATGATEVENLQYADRLGLWGSGTAFRDATDFVEKIKAGGVAAMELVASNMKENGVYLSRNISYDGVQYDRITHKLNKNQTETYGELARAWQLVLKNMNKALELTNQGKDGQSRGNQNRAFWSGQQRFFNQVLTAMQTPSVIKDIERQLEQGKSAVIQLVSTNEAAQKRESERLQEEGLDLESFDLTPKQILMSYIENVFPTQQYEEFEDEDGKKHVKPVYDSNGDPVLNAEAVEKKEELLMKLGALKVPSSPIDMIIEHFGADQVAEVTGRSKRVYRKGGKMVEETRNKSTNAVDVDAFQNGDKRILVFSGAGATGKSYHADRNAKNQQQRVHYLLEAGWVANKAVQGFGRSHRSNQATTPIFKLVTTDLKGQNRFISTIAKRLSQLGALTKGSAKAGNQGMFTADDDLEGPIASDVLANYYKELMLGKVPTVDDGMDVIEKLGLKNYLVDEYGSFKEHDAWRDVTKFLNRILVLEPDEQNAVFDGFNNRLLAANEIARQNGTLDRGLENYRADNLSIKESKIVRTDEATRAQTTYYNLEAKHKITPIGFGSIKTDDPVFEGFYRNKNNDTVRAMFRSNTKTDEYGRIIQNYRSQTPIGYNYLDEGQLARNWEKIKSDEAKTLWDKAVKDSPAYRTNPVHLLTGNLLSIWGKMPSENVRVYRMMTDDGNVLLGRVIANDQIDGVLRQLGSSRTKEIVPAAEIIRKIQKDGATVYLEDGWRIKQSRVSNEPRLEIIGPEYRDMQALERAGVFSERISWTTRFFIPTGDKAPDVLDKVLRISGLVRIDSKDEVFSLEEDDEREDVSDGSSERQDGNGAGIAARRLDQRSRSYQKGRETADQRREQGKALKDAGNTEQKEYGRGLRRVRGEFIKREAYNPRMQAIAAENKSRGINTEFILGTLDISYHPKNKARGMYDRATNTIIVQYDHPYYSPEQLNRHELYHAEAKSERGKKALNVIRNSLSLVDRKTALDKLERDYNGIASGNEDMIIEEFVANTLAGMNEYAETYQELVNDYWDGNEIDVDKYDPAEYTESIDAGGNADVVDNIGFGENGTIFLADSRVSGADDAAYMDAVQKGDMDTAQAMVNIAAEKSGAYIFEGDERNNTVYSIRTKSAPRKTIKVYKLFDIVDGKPAALYIDKATPKKNGGVSVKKSTATALPVGVWLDGKEGEWFLSENGRKMVYSKLGPLSYRPGWHASNMPFTGHIGDNISDVPWGKAKRPNQVYYECEIDADYDYAKEVEQRRIAENDNSLGLDRLPTDGYYEYKTNSNAVDELKWYISGAIKIVRPMSEREVNAMIRDYITPQLWETKQGAKIKPTSTKTRVNATGTLSLEDNGIYSTEPLSNTGKLLDAVTYDDNGKIIPLSQRFNTSLSDPRYSLNRSQQGVMWTIGAGVMDKRDVAQFYSKIAEAKKQNYQNYHTASDGSIIFEVGHDKSVGENKLVYTDGDFEFPEITKVITFRSKDSRFVDLAKEDVYGAEETGYSVEGIIQAHKEMYGDEFASIADSEDYEADFSASGDVSHRSSSVSKVERNDDLSFSLDTIDNDEAEYTPEKRAEMLEDFRNDNMAVKKKTVQESLIGASAHIKDMASRLARVFPEIPERGKEGTFYAEFRKNMVQWKALPQTASFKVQDALRNMTKDLDPDDDDYEIFSQLVYFLDLQEEAEMQESRGVENVRLPHGYTHAQVNGIVDDLQNEASDKVKAALKKRSRIWKELVNSYVANNQYIGFDTANRFNRKHYYRHQVIDYMNTRGIGGKRTEINDRRGWLKARKGSDLATNTDFLEVEYNAMLQMTHDMYVANLLGKTKQRYDIKPQLELQARRLNQDAIKEIIKKEANGRMTAKGEPDSETFRQQQWYNRRIMMGFSNLMDLGSMGKLPELGGGYRNVIAALSSGSLKANGLYKYIGELAATEDIDEDVRIAAQTVLKFTNQKRQWVKALLGNGFNTWETLAKATEGYSIHQPRRGNYFYNKTIIDEDAFAQAFNTVVTSIAAGDPGIFTPESMKEMIEQYGETVRLIGAPYEQWVIPDKIIKTLDEVANPKEGGTGSLIARSMLNAWKGWSTSVNPLRTLKFGLRNLVGDVDAVIAGKPQVLTYTPRAVKEIYQAMVKKNYTPDMQEWTDRGGYTSMMFINEMDREAQEKLFKNLVDKTGKGVFEALKIPKKIISGYTDKVQAMHDFREAILRYSSYLYFKDNLAENEGKVTDYVASNRWIVQGLESNEDKAYQLSKDLLGAYDEVSRIGQNLRRYWIPFYSFTETNFKRYTRMFENVIRGQGSIPKKAAKVLLKALQVNLLAMLMIAWNRLLKKDDDDKLPPSVRNIPHITLGRIGEDVYAFRQLGSFTELLEWIGLDDFKWDEEDLLAPVDKLTGMITPAISGTASMLTGLNFYPSVRNPQVIRDRWSYFFNSLGVDGPFDIWRGKPNKGWGNVAKGAFVYSYDIEESAYNEIISHKYNWQGRDDGTIYGATDKSNALYYMKKAIKYKDEETALKYLDKYFEAGGTGNGIASSLERLNPMYGFTGKDTQAKGKEWIASMTDDEKDKLRVAIQYYEQDLSLPKEVAAQLRKKKNGVTDQEAKNLLQRYIKAKCK